MAGQLNIFFSKNAHFGIECIPNDDSTISFTLVCIEKIKGEFKVTKQLASIKNIEELLKVLPKGISVAITLSGNNCIHKKIFISEQDTEVTILNQVLPNARFEDFFIQKHQCIDQSWIISVIRKESIEKVNLLFKENDIAIVSVTLGPVNLPGFLKYLPIATTNNELKLVNYHIDLTTDGIIDFRYETFPIEDLLLEGKSEKISNQFIIAFSSAFSQSGVLKINSTQPITIEKNKFDFEQKIFLKKISYYSLAIAFVLLFINFFILMSLNKKKNFLETNVRLNESAIQEFKKADEDLKNIKKLLSQSGLTGASAMSFYSDQVGASVPEAITLKELKIQPAIPDFNNEDSISFIPKTVMLSGTCIKAEDLNLWIKKLKTLEWIKDISLEDFKKNEDNEDQEFKLNIKL